MAEKGGKGVSLPKGGAKSSLKTSGSFKGKADSSPNRGRKVQFDSEDSTELKTNLSSKSGGKGDIPVTKGDWGKGGKGGKGEKVANGGKSQVPKRPSELNNELELPKNTKCLMDCEAADILQGIQEQMVILSEDPTIKIPISFDKGLQYATNGSRYTSSQSVREVLEPLKKHGVTDREICVIANIRPESGDEVFALVPSLKGKKNKLTEPLKVALSELAKLKLAA